MNLTDTEYPSTERLYDLTNTYEISNDDVRAILQKLLEKLGLIPTKTTYLRKDVEMVSYDLEPRN
jgi:hypothetical protein